MFRPKRPTRDATGERLGTAIKERSAMLDMRRREFITLIGVAAGVWPLAARAQEPIRKIRRLGLLQPGLPESSFGKAMRDRLRALGYLEGRDIVLETRWAEGKAERLTELAVELASLKLDAIVAFTTPAAIAAREATTTIPVVFLYVGDPVGTGVVPSLPRPGGNVTGISLLATELSSKRLEILLEIAPNTSRVAMLWIDSNPGMVLRARESQNVAPKLGVKIQSVGVHDLVNFDSAFSSIENGRIDALLTLVDPFTSQHRNRIVEFAAQRRLPAIYEAREFVESGGLISYGPNPVAMEQRAAEYVDKIFKGVKAADLPVEQPTKFELIINLKTAKALGLDVPATVLARADEVIE
jgi:putative ABC transport system substrate-binding protein